jgi:uncharacterized membrane protein
VAPVASYRADELAQERITENMDLLIGLLRAALMLGFVVAVIIALAGLFMIVFGIATGIDRRIQN